LKLFLPGVLLLFAACQTVEGEVESLATSHASADFHTYRLRRVGLFAFHGEDVTFEDGRDLQSSFFSEISGIVPFEVVPLDVGDIAEIPISDPFRTGAYKPRTVIEVARRFRLDGAFVGTVTDRQQFSPQRLGLQVDLVAAETGLVIWSGSVHLDAAQERVRENVRLWAEGGQGDIAEIDWKLSLLSPRRFAHFAAYQLARQLRSEPSAD
jgi:hypothetical protein